MFTKVHLRWGHLLGMLSIKKSLNFTNSDTISLLKEIVSREVLTLLRSFNSLWPPYSDDLTISPTSANSLRYLHFPLTQRCLGKR